MGDKKELLKRIAVALEKIASRTSGVTYHAVPSTQAVNKCSVCGIDFGFKPMSYTCTNKDCPTRVNSFPGYR